MARGTLSAEVINAILRETLRAHLTVTEGRNGVSMLDPAMDVGEKLAVLVEEVGEVAKATLSGYDSGDPELRSLQEGHDLEKELIQVAAMAASWLEALYEERRDAAYFLAASGVGSAPQVPGDAAESAGAATAPLCARCAVRMVASGAVGQHGFRCPRCGRKDSWELHR